MKSRNRKHVQGKERGGKQGRTRAERSVESLEQRTVFSAVSVWTSQSLNQDANGTHYDTSYNTYTYFPSGATAATASSVDYGSNGSIDFVNSEVTYFESGAVERSLSRIDYNRDGRADGISERVYRADGQLKAETIQTFTNGRLSSDYRVETDYRSNGTRKSWVVTTRTDVNLDGKFDSGVQETQEFNTQNQLILQLRREDYQGDGKYDFTPSEYRWNDAGQNLYSGERSDANRDGVADTWYENTTVYAKKTGLLQSQTEVRGQDITGDGLVDTTTRRSSYDPAGNLLTFTVSVDYRADKSVDIITEEVKYSTQRLISRTTRADNNFDGVPDQLREEVYNDTGANTHFLEAYDFNLDGTFDLYSSRDAVFDSQNRLIEAVITRRESGQEFYFRDTYTYDAQGVLTETTREVNQPGLHELTRRVSTYLADGTPVGMVETVDYGNDGSVDLVSEEYRWDPQGRLVYRIERTDADRDGTVERFYETVSVYVSGVRVSTTTTTATDPDQDGVLDHEIYREEQTIDGLRTTTTTIYDALGDGDYEYVSVYTQIRDANYRLRREEKSVDDDGDGVVDYLALEIDYAEFGDVLSWIERRDNNGDGELDYVYRRTREYDADRNLLLERTTTDYLDSNDSDSTIESIYVFVDGRLVTRISRRDNQSNGTWDTVSRIDYTFNSQGRVINVTEVNDSNGDGQNESRRTTVTTYFDSGELESELITQDYGDDGIDIFVQSHLILLPGLRVVLDLRQNDYDGDGVPNSINMTQNEYDSAEALVSSFVVSGYDSYPWDNVIEVFSVEESTYWANGRVHTSRNGYDYDGDYELDFVANEYERNEDGVTIWRRGKGDLDGDGIAETYTETTYDSFGLPLTDLYSVDNNEDGVPDETHERTYVWDYQRFVRLSAELRYSNDQGFSFTLLEEERAYDDAGRLTKDARRVDSNRDGVLDFLEEVTITYNDTGEVVFSELRYGTNADGDALLDVMRVVSLRDAEGRLIERRELDYGATAISPDIVLSESRPSEDGVGRVGIQRVDRNVDGIVDERTETHWNQFGYETYREFWLDSDFDGQPDDYLLIEAEYDAAGSRLRSRTEDITGRVYLTEVETDAEGRASEIIERFDREGDGVWDTVHQRELSYQSGFNLLDEIDRFDLDGDGNWDEIKSVDRTFGSNGLLLSYVEFWDYDADGEADFFVRQDSYDEFGRLLSGLSQSDSNRDSDPEYTELTERRYDADGNEVFSVRATDYNGDGVYDQYEKTTKQFVDLGDDLVLVQELAATVQQLGLTNKLRDSLLKPLNSAIKRLSDTNPSNDAGAASDLQSFIKSVEKEAKNGTIKTVDANLLAVKARQAVLFIG